MFSNKLSNLPLDYFFKKKFHIEVAFSIAWLLYLQKGLIKMPKNSINHYKF